MPFYFYYDQNGNVLGFGNHPSIDEAKKSTGFAIEASRELIPKYRQDGLKVEANELLERTESEVRQAREEKQRREDDLRRRQVRRMLYKLVGKRTSLLAARDELNVDYSEELSEVDGRVEQLKRELQEMENSS